MVQMSNVELFAYSSLKIEATNDDGSWRSTGTGFIFSIPANSDSHHPLLITSKHVIENATSVTFSFHLKQPDSDLPLIGVYTTAKITNIRDMIVQHPDQSIDLAAIQLGYIMRALEDNGVRLFYAKLDEHLLPSECEWNELSPIENIYVVGYPDAIWDSVNNMPIIRRGITATHPNIPYDGRDEFLIDCAIYQGSSGSPVILHDSGVIVDKYGKVSFGTRTRLLGIVYGLRQHLVMGVVTPGIFGSVPVAIGNVQSAVPNNLGAVIKSSEIIRFKDVIDLEKRLDVHFG